MPFGNALSGWHIVLILVVILLLFGAPKLPGLAKSLGQSMRIFKSEVKQMKADDDTDDAKGGDRADAKAESSDSGAEAGHSEPPTKN